MIAAQPDGTDAFVDVVFPGTQATLEHRIPIYGVANQLTLRGNGLATIPFYESQLDAELRIVVLTLGASGGFRHTMRHLEFDPGERIDSDHRRDREIDGDFSHATFGFGELRATLSLPINDYVLFNAINSARFEGRPDRSFDWRNAVVHDGTVLKSDLWLIFKHRDWGGLGPIAQILDFGLGDRRFTQINYGFLLTTRPGFVRRNDIFFVQFLFHPGSSLGAFDNQENYGAHLFFAPISFQLAYRMVLPVWREE
jgi:hypothetical protein